MHLYLYQANTNLLLKRTNVEALIKSLPIFLHERARRYKSERAAINFAYGRILLRKGLEDLIEDASLEDVLIADNDKPYHEYVQFNISHSSYRVLCALSLDGSVGVDVEEIVERDFKAFEAFFTDQEWEHINQSPDVQVAFTRLWTRKESIIKATGRGLQQLNELNLDPTSDQHILNGKEWFLTELDVSGAYQGALCTEFPIESLEIVHF